MRQRFGKYQIGRRLAGGGYATVYRALDTVTGVPVALKLPHAGLITKELLESFRKEVRLAAKLDHPNILPVKDAGFIDGRFYIAYPLGEATLGDRLKRRLSGRTILLLTDQTLEAVAFAHSRRIMHCDIKPENFILFPGNRLRLTDFGIARLAQRTLVASGSGTVGYIAPEQAMGRPSFRSDVFSLGLILYRMFSGQLPEWPYTWPPPGFDRLRKTLHPDAIRFLRRAIEVNHRKRFADATQMLAAYRRLRPHALRSTLLRRKRRGQARKARRDWRTIRHHEFLKQHGANLHVRGACGRCHGPIAETMPFCPWCGSWRTTWAAGSRFPSRCPRCKRGMKSDWRFCPWCYGPAINVSATRRYSDVRYETFCANPACKGPLMRFMRYCPWCRRKVQRAWRVPGSADRCPRCGWGVLRDYWDFCPWCARSISRRVAAGSS